MGTIKSQSVSTTIISYIGVVIGFVTSALIMPKVLTSDQLGLVKLIVAVTGVFAGVFSFGVSQLLYRTYPRYSDDSKKLSKLFYLSIKISLLGTLVALPVYYLMAYDLFNYEIKVPSFEKTEFFIASIFVVIVFRLFYVSIFGYIRMMSKVVIDAIIQNIILKGGILLLISLFVFGYLDYSLFVYGLMILYIFFPLILIFYLIKNNSFPKIRFGERFSKYEKKEFFSLSLFGMLTTIGGSIYLYIDTLMVSHYLGESDVGIYGTMFLFGVIVIIPARGMKNIAVSIISKSFQSGNFDEVVSIYKKSSITLLIVGGFIFLGVYTNLYSVFGYLPEIFSVGAPIVLFIGAAQLLDMICGVNYEVIAASKHYRINTWFTFLTAISAILLNVIFIPTYGTTGAAVATFSSILLVNLLRIIAVWKLFKIHPFTIKSLYAIGVLVGSYVIVVSIPDFDNYILNLFFKGSILTLIYIPAVYFLKLSEDINDLIDKVISFVLKRK